MNSNEPSVKRMAHSYGHCRSRLMIFIPIFLYCWHRVQFTEQNTHIVLPCVHDTGNRYHTGFVLNTIYRDPVLAGQHTKIRLKPGFTFNAHAHFRKGF